MQTASTIKLWVGEWTPAKSWVHTYEAVLFNVYFVMWKWLIVDMLQTLSVRKTESIMKWFERTLYVEQTFHKAGDFHKAGLAMREAFARSFSPQCYQLRISWASWKESIYLVSNKCVDLTFDTDTNSDETVISAFIRKGYWEKHISTRSPSDGLLF